MHQAALGVAQCVTYVTATLPYGGWELTADVIVMVFAQKHLEFEAAPENGGDFGTDR